MLLGGWILAVGIYRHIRGRGVFPGPVCEQASRFDSDRFRGNFR